MKWLKRFLLAVLILLSILAIVQLIRWALARNEDPDATFIMPRLTVAAMNIEQLDPQMTKAFMVMMIDQPAPVGLTIDSLQYVLSIAGTEVIRSTYASAISIPAYDSALVTMPVSIRTRPLMELLERLEAQGLDSVEYTMDTEFHVPAAFWRGKPIAVNLSRKLPLIKIPRVELLDPTIEKFGFGQTRMNVDLAMFNPNVFDIAIRDLVISARLEDHEVLMTSSEELIAAPANDTALIHLPMRMAPGRLIEGVFDLLVKPARTPYSYRMEFTIVSEQAALHNARFVVVGDGTLDELKKMR